MTTPLRSDPITESSTLLRAPPPLCPASVLLPSRRLTAWISPFASGRQVPVFLTEACLEITPPSCRTPVGPSASRLPSFSYSTEHLDEDRLCNEHFREPLDQGLQAMFWHHGDKFVEHATLPEQGVSASRGRVGLEMSIEAERFPGCAEQGQQRNREGIDQPQAVTPVGGTDVHRAEAHAEANILTITERTLDSPPLGVEVDQLPCEFVGVAGGQAPRLLHAFGLHAHHSADRIADGGHCGTSHHARPAALADPFGCRPRLPVGSGHPDVATEADDEVELQLVGQHPV